MPWRCARPIGECEVLVVVSFGNLFAPPKKNNLQISTDIRKYFTKDLDYYVIPEGVTSIRSYAFYNFWPESREFVLQLPSTLTYIAPYAFSECAVKEVILPAGVKIIDHHAFYGAELNKITFGEGLEEIGEAAFMNGPVLENVILPDSIRKIGANAFSGMDIKDGGAIVEIGESIQSIGDGAFDCAVRSIVVHRKYGTIKDGSLGWFNKKGDWFDPPWYGGNTGNPEAIWDGDS